MQRMESFKGPSLSRGPVFGNICMVFLYMTTLQALFCLSATEEINCINSIDYSQNPLDMDTSLLWTAGESKPYLHFL